MKITTNSLLCHLTLAVPLAIMSTSAPVFAQLGGGFYNTNGVVCGEETSHCGSRQCAKDLNSLPAVDIDVISHSPWQAEGHCGTEPYYSWMPLLRKPCGNPVAVGAVNHADCYEDGGLTRNDDRESDTTDLRKNIVSLRDSLVPLMGLHVSTDYEVVTPEGIGHATTEHIKDLDRWRILVTADEALGMNSVDLGFDGTVSSKVDLGVGYYSHSSAGDPYTNAAQVHPTALPHPVAFPFAFLSDSTRIDMRHLTGSLWDDFLAGSAQVDDHLVYGNSKIYFDDANLPHRIVTTTEDVAAMTEIRLTDYREFPCGETVCRFPTSISMISSEPGQGFISIHATVEHFQANPSPAVHVFAAGAPLRGRAPLKSLESMMFYDVDNQLRVE